MRLYPIALAAAAAFFLWTASHNDGAALANSGFLGTWCGSSMFAYTITDSPRLMVKQGRSEESYAHYSGTKLVTERWAQTGTLSSDGTKITWGDGNVWVRTTAGAERCGSFASVAATPTPKPYRYLDWTSDEGPRPPIELVNAWAAVMRNGSMVYACVSFKNTSAATATRIDFEFPLSNNSRHVVDTAHFDRKGTFSPHVEIHGWHNLAEWTSVQGPRGYYDNCVRWRPANEAEQIAYSHLHYYTIHVKRMDFADGTTWPSP